MTRLYTVEAVAPGPSNAVGIHEHPILESGNLSFPKGRYLLDFEPQEDRTSYIVTHRIEGASLISRLLDSLQAQYVCIVSSPISSYRCPHVSEEARQEVRWNADELGEPPLFTPMIVCSEPQEITLSASQDGVHDIWDSQPITLHKGSRLALGSVIQLELTSILHLLSLHEDPELDHGRFVVEIEAEPFRFRANVSSDLHRFLRRPASGENRRNIMTHIVTACLACLQRDYSEDDGEAGWQSHRNLKMFADYLTGKGLDHWSQPEFRPEKVATALFPHVLPSGLATDAEEDEIG